jgi:beta-lactam-binding protein with PASTA domain
VFTCYAAVPDHYLGLLKEDFMVTVPNLVGMSLTNAKTAVANAGLTEGTISFNNQGVSNTVLTQDPAANTSVSEGTAVNVTSSGHPSPTVIWGH